jgi:hypothetical protein
MKIVALLLTFCMTLNVFAASGTTGALERELDQYQYALTVDWDQKDQVVYEKETKAFFERLGSLVNEQGVSKAEILALAEKKMGSKVALEALKLKLSLVGELNSSAQIASVLRENSKDLYSQGASWSGNTDTVLIGLAIAALVGYLVWFNANYDCVAYDQRWECDTHVYEYSSSTSCGWESYCIAYEKK